MEQQVNQKTEARQSDPRVQLNLKNTEYSSTKPATSNIMQSLNVERLTLQLKSKRKVD